MGVVGGTAGAVKRMERTRTDRASAGDAAPRGPVAPAGGFVYGAADEERRHAVRRMKALATGLLLAVALVYALATWAGRAGAGGWTGFVAAAAEAGMVGALADWFAVTALFKRPMGLPIPHTAIIPTKKDQLGQSLGDFVGENFLSAEVVRRRLRSVGIGRRLGGWLAEPRNADRVTAELSTALRGALTVLRDSDVQAVVGEAITRRADAQEIAPGLGTMLEKVVAEGGHRRVVDLVVARAHDWLVEHGDSVMAAVSGGAPGWTPRFVDRKVGDRVYKELLRFVTEMRDMPEHPARAAIDRFLRDFADDLQTDPDTRSRVEHLKSEVLGRGEVQDLIASAWAAVREMIVAAAEDEHSELRLRVRAALLSLGRRLSDEERLQAKVDGWLEGAAVYVVTTYQHEITSLITDTVAGWDATHTSRKIEAHIGRDLQFIRINGTVVGALAGLAIYTVSHVFG
ncbi:membrane protein [Streptomyces nigrescens]|uniref:Membrane protein n=2 Tax=Streptomyces TaxID=1883 RepID=A0ABM7ZL13_STRNI|nr:membrane protein [Streptomyces nigrescens]